MRKKGSCRRWNDGVEKETENIKAWPRFIKQRIAQTNGGKYHFQERGSVGPGQQPKKKIVMQKLLKLQI